MTMIEIQDTIRHTEDFIRGVSQVERLFETAEAGATVLPSNLVRLTRRSELRALKSIGAYLYNRTSDIQRAAVEPLYRKLRVALFQGTHAKVATDKAIFSLRDQLISKIGDAFPGDTTALEATIWAFLIDDFLKGRRLNGALFH